MKRVDKYILKDLYESINGLYAFTFYSRYSIEPDQMFNFITEYEEKGIINYNDDKLSLTENGRKIILKQIFIAQHLPGKFSNIPEEFIGQKIEINFPYLPDIKNVTSEILNLKKVE